MKALVLAHDHLSPAGALLSRLIEHGFTVDERVIVPEERYNTPNVEFEFPKPGDYSVVIILGAPWGAWDDETIGSWLAGELDWIRALHASGTPTLGVCFGGQAIARALGGSVGPGDGPELGFSIVHSDDCRLIESGPWFQFHYDRWVVPPTATEVARNSFSSQAFVAGRMLAVQFHPELDSRALDVWAQDGVLADQIRATGQNFERLAAHVAAVDDDSHARASRLIDSFLSRVARIDTPIAQTAASI